MLNPEYLSELPEEILKLFAEAEVEILADMARRIAKYDFWIPSADYQNQKLLEAGILQEDILQILSAVTRKSEAELRRMMQEAGSMSLKADGAVYEAAGLNVPSIKDSEPLKKILNAGYKATAQTMRNLCRTTANAAARQFESVLDAAWLKVQSGAFSADTAIRDAIKALSEQGVQAIRYRSGRTDSLEVAVRRAVVTGANQTSAQLQEELADELECDLVEVSAHSGARPEHAKWQGKIFSRSGTHPKYPDFKRETGYGTGAGLCGWNCRHTFGPYIEGSAPVWTEEALAELDKPKYEYNGEQLTEYEAEQQQRYHERQIRRWKREEIAMNAAGLDCSEAAAKVKYWQGVQADFIEQTGFARQYEREQITVAKSLKSDIIGTDRGGQMGLDITIDRFTPCLLDNRTGKLVETRYMLATKQELTGLKKSGWLFNWTGKDLKDAEIYKLCIKDDDTLQGLVAIKDMTGSYAYYLQLAESAPHNRGEEKQYDGVGGHLFAIAAQKSLESGYGGFICLEAKNMELVQHYRTKFGAKWIGGVHQYRMIIDEEAASELLQKYTLNEE